MVQQSSIMLEARTMPGTSRSRSSFTHRNANNARKLLTSACMRRKTTDFLKSLLMSLRSLSMASKETLQKCTNTKVSNLKPGTSTSRLFVLHVHSAFVCTRPTKPTTKGKEVPTMSSCHLHKSYLNFLRLKQHNLK